MIEKHELARAVIRSCGAGRGRRLARIPVRAGKYGSTRSNSASLSSAAARPSRNATFVRTLPYVTVSTSAGVTASRTGGKRRPASSSRSRLRRASARAARKRSSSAASPGRWLARRRCSLRKEGFEGIDAACFCRKPAVRRSWRCHRPRHNRIRCAPSAPSCRCATGRCSGSTFRGCRTARRTRA
jgi:hypothetical protein